jgi:hypothetical protein
VSVHVFVEGGGSQNRTRTECRKAFHLFFQKLLAGKRQPRISACGNRHEAYEDFCRSVQSSEDTVAVLLVDSEDPVTTGKSPCDHLRERDQWMNLAPEHQVHLMVQCMESWFLADRAALKKYCGDGFRTSALPGNPNLEAIPKQDVLRGLERATKDTTKGEYHKSRHGFGILEVIDPQMVRNQSPHASVFLDFLIAQLTQLRL